MNGRHHISAGGAAGVACLSLGVIGLAGLNENEASRVVNIFTGDPLRTGIGALLYLAGTLLPDVDHPQSLLGRSMYIPVEHRTWTHTVWVVMLFAGLGFIEWAFWPLAFGVFVHLVCDSWSKCGVCWFYPISRYKHFGAKAKIKDGHFFYLYSTPFGEAVTCGVMWAVAAFLTAAAVFCFVPRAADAVGITGLVGGLKSLMSAAVRWLFRL